MIYATSTANLDRSTPDAVDGAGDPVDDWAISVAVKIPVGIVEKSRRVFFPETLESRVIRYATGRFYPNVGVQRGDRVSDLGTGKKWIVDSEVVPNDRGLVGHATISVELRALGDK